MNILVLNASPKKKKSNTIKLTEAFVQGINSKVPSQVKVIEVYSKNIKACIGCFHCWAKTPGKCIHKDDMDEIIQDILWADLIIWSFPLYYYSIPSGAKALMDRLLPMSLPFMDPEAQGGGHPSRYDMSGKKYFLISTCGFYTDQGNYQAVLEQFDQVYGEGAYDYIFTGQGELFSIDQLHARTGAYLEIVERAGEEYALGQISKATEDDLSQLLYPRETFEEMADLHWGLGLPEKKDQDKENLKKGDIFIRQMASLYNPKSWTKDRVLEFDFTDVKESYQILLTKEGHQVIDEDFEPFTTKVITPLETWQDIGAGKISGPAAMAQGLFFYKGDFDLVLNWDEFFGQGLTESKNRRQSSGSKKKDPSLAIMVLPWLVMWISLSIDQKLGGLITILATSLVHLAFIKRQATAYDHLSQVLVTVLALAGLVGLDPKILNPLSYLAFGLMWLISSFRPIPLSAHYSKLDFGGDAAFDNPIFMKTNRVISRAWGLVYMLMIAAYIILLRSPLAAYASLLVLLGPIGVGMFTIWYQNWYPASVAKAK